MRFLVQLLLILCLLEHENHIIFARQTLPRRVPGPSVTAASNISAALTQPNSNSSASSSRSMINNHTHTKAGGTVAFSTPVYPNINSTGNHRTTKSNQVIKSTTCAMKDLYCSSERNSGVVWKANTTSFDDPCVFWDPFCSGNKTLARDKFFNQDFQRDVLGNRCFVLEGSVNLGNISSCDKYNPPGRMHEFQKMKNWMRSQQCASAGMAWAAQYESDLDPDSHIAIQMDPYEYGIVSGAHPSCCGVCETNVQNVDIYYWPERDVNTSCLNIIGDSVRPVTYGATKITWSFGTITTTDYFWGCTPKPSTSYDASISESITDPGTTNTAMIRTIGTLLVKVYLSDPWSPSPCTETVISQQLSGSVTVQDRYARMHARDHTLIIPSSFTHDDISPVTTMISGNFTL